MKTIIYLCIILIVGISSCTNLDEKVFSSITEDNYIYTEKDLIPVLGSTYPPLRGLLSHTGYIMAQETTADGIVMPANSAGWDDGGRYRIMHYHTWNSEQDHVKNMWNFSYRGIVLCNQALDKIEKNIIPIKDDKIKKSAIAEVKSLRAFYYWLICDNFGDAPLHLTASTDLLPKSPRKDIFDAIIKDLTDSFPYLSKEVDLVSYGRMNYWAAKALLANVYLNAEVYTGVAKWEECKNVCDDIINSGKFDLEKNFRDVFCSEGRKSKEIIFTISYDEKYGTGNNIHMYSWHAALAKKFQLKTTPWGSGSAQGVTQFINTYNPNDTRLSDTWLFGPQFEANGTTPLRGLYDKIGEPLVFKKELPNGNYTSEMEGYRMNKFEVLPNTQAHSSTDFPLFRYSQVLLMKAESLLRQGLASEAATIVTEVRVRNFKNTPSEAIVTGNKLNANSVYEYGYVEQYVIKDKGNTDIIRFGGMLDELGWEFIWEAHRRRDLIRYGVFTKKSWLSHKPQGDYRSVFPIPEPVLTSNPLLKQNPNYAVE